LGVYFLGEVNMPKRQIQAKPANLKMERNFARDVKVFAKPNKTNTTPWESLHTGRIIQSVVIWKHEQHERRVFVLPAIIASNQYLELMHFARDVLAALTTLYMQKNSPDNPTLVTTYSELCRVLGISPNGETKEKISDALAILVMYTIKNQSVVIRFTKNGKAEWGEEIFGFLDRAVWVNALGDLDGPKEKLPPRKQRLEITLSKKYLELLNMMGPKKQTLLAEIPFSALQATRQLNRKQIVPAKNIIYYLAGRGGNARLKKDTLINIMGIKNIRPSKTNKTMLHILECMATKNILSYRFLSPDLIDLKLCCSAD